MNWKKETRIVNGVRVVTSITNRPWSIRKHMIYLKYGVVVLAYSENTNLMTVRFERRIGEFFNYMCTLSDQKKGFVKDMRGFCTIDILSPETFARQLHWVTQKFEGAPVNPNVIELKRANVFSETDRG
jgi:hypothetical protein